MLKHVAIFFLTDPTLALAGAAAAIEGDRMTIIVDADLDAHGRREAICEMLHDQDLAPALTLTA